MNRSQISWLSTHVDCRLRKQYFCEKWIACTYKETETEEKNETKGKKYFREWKMKPLINELTKSDKDVTILMEAAGQYVRCCDIESVDNGKDHLSRGFCCFKSILG